MFSWNWIIRFHWILAWCAKLLWDCAWQPNFFAQKLGEWAKNRLFDFKEKSGHSFSLNLFHKFFFCYLMCSCTNPIFGKNIFPEIQAKMLSANQIAGFLNQVFLQNKLMKQPHFCHVDANSQQLKVEWKFFIWAWSKMALTNLVSGLQNWLYLKSEMMGGTNFCMLVQIYAN